MAGGAEMTPWRLIIFDATLSILAVAGVVFVIGLGLVL